MERHLSLFVACSLMCLQAIAQPPQTVGPTTINAGSAVGLDIEQHPTADYQFGILLKTERDATKAFSLLRHENNQTYFTIWGNGVVNIKKLYAMEVEVRPDAMGLQWPDYVFEPGYDRFSIDETEQFIADHHHLPLLPSAEMVKEKGFDVTTVITQLLETIENQSLQIIELNTRIKALEEKPTRN